MKKLFYFAIPLFLIFFVQSCDKVIRSVNSNYAEEQDQKKALDYFIEESQYMTEREALSKEINYYKQPNIVRQEYIGTISGKSLIHIANEINKEDQNQIGFGPSNIKIIHKVDDIKEVGLNHPNEQVAKVYVFGGDFVHFRNGASRIFKIIVYIPEIERFIDVNGRFIDSINTHLDLNSEDYKWIWDLPSWSDIPL